MTTSKNIDSVWVVEHIDPNKRLLFDGEPVEAFSEIIIKHIPTNHFLASDKIDYRYICSQCLICDRNDFGSEYEVCVKSYATLNKSQNLSLEKGGKITREQPTKIQHPQNAWMMITSESPAAEHIPEPSQYSIHDLLRDIKEKLLQRGAYGIRGVYSILTLVNSPRTCKDL
jgi:hypothetical protein